MSEQNENEQEEVVDAQDVEASGTIDDEGRFEAVVTLGKAKLTLVLTPYDDESCESANVLLAAMPQAVTAVVKAIIDQQAADGV